VRGGIDLGQNTQTLVNRLHRADAQAARGGGQQFLVLAEYEALGREFQLVRSLIEARIESGQVKPSTAALERLAKATGLRLKITFEPAEAR
jgi:hypothetical protein